MFLNTNLIKDSVISKNIITENISPLILRDQQLQSIKIEKERKLQEQVAMIFKDRNYYKQFQEAVILTDEQMKKKAAKEELEAEKDSNSRRLKLGAGLALASGIIGTLSTISNDKKQVHESVTQATPLTDDQLQEKAAREKMEAEEDRRNNRQLKFGAKAAIVGGSMGTLGAVLTKVAANSVPFIRKSL